MTAAPDALDWAPFVYRPSVRRRADSMLRLMRDDRTPAGERTAAARHFVMVTAAMPACDDDALYTVLLDADGVTVMCESGAEWAPCDSNDPVAVAEAVRRCGAVPRYWRGTMRAAYPVRKAVAA